ncbi:MAG: rhomboid family intramembrane serine protease [Acidobacteriota bacterium]
MILVLPLGPEDAPTELPRVTSALIALNIAVFLLVNGPADRVLERKTAELERLAQWEVEKERAARPGALPARDRYPTALAYLSLDPAWRETVSREARDRLDGYVEEYDGLRASHPFYRYGFVPSQPSALRLVTHQFLHGDLLHILFNMIFLWSAGSYLESVWGAPLFALSYLGSGCAAAIVHALCNRGSVETAIGASGAIAGLMGAILASNPAARMKVAFVYALSLAPRIRFFAAPTGVLVGLWLLQQVFMTLMTVRIAMPVAFAAHLGGFGAGVLASVIRRLVAGPAGG